MKIKVFLLKRPLWKIFWLANVKTILVFNNWFSLVTFIFRLNKLYLNIIVFRTTRVNTEMFRCWGMCIRLVLKLLIDGLNLFLPHIVFLPGTIESIPLISEMIFYILKSWGFRLRNRWVRDIWVGYWLRSITTNHDIILLFKLKI